MHAAASGTVVVRCLPPSHPGAPDANCPANDNEVPIDNHGAQGIAILEHTLPAEGVVYSLYGQLGDVDPTLAVGQLVNPGQLLGSTNDLNQVHFEIKDRPVIHNPYCPVFHCSEPVTLVISSTQPHAIGVSHQPIHHWRTHYKVIQINLPIAIRC